MSRRPTPLALYRAVSRLLTPAAPLLLRWRARRGKEDPARISERRGFASLERPPGRLAWLHGASVGEGMALLPLISRLRGRGFEVLLTTGTVTSAQVLAERLPAGAMHQFAPVDAPRYVTRFMEHWRPDLALIAESELWPNLLAAADAARTPTVLVNARLSQRSYERWLHLPDTIGALLRGIDLCLAQSAGDATRLMDLGAARVQVAGNLKYDVPALPADPTQLARLRGALGSRPVWLAASTHEGEEQIALAAHHALLARFPNLVTIVAPRHAARGAAVADMARKYGVAATRRSLGELPGAGAQFHIADTMGELGLFYRVCGAVFVGKSLSGDGGQNPIEPAKLGSAILHGPHVANFADVYAELDARDGALLVADAESLTGALTMLLADTRRLREMARTAGEVVDAYGGAVEKIMQALEPYVLQMELAGR